MSENDEHSVFGHTIRRARPIAESHDRNGRASKFTSSKAYNAIPKLYARDKKFGFKGIYCGPLAEGDGFLTGPAFDKDNTRSVIREMVFSSEVNKREEVPEFTERLFGYGQYMELKAFEWIPQVLKALDPKSKFALIGRIDSLKYGWIASSMDAIAYYKGQTWCIEIKTAIKRTIQLGDDRDDPTWVPGQFCNEVEIGTAEEPELVEVEHHHIQLHHQAKIPVKYFPQLLLHAHASGVPRCLVIQVREGGPLYPPFMTITEWHFDLHLWDTLFPWWQLTWAKVEEGRRVMDDLDKAEAEADRSGNRQCKLEIMSRRRDFIRDFPSPKEKCKGKNLFSFAWPVYN